jgi:hypothetical protein
MARNRNWTARPIQLMIAGAQKAATSSLQNYLGQHPEIVTHGRGEINFFVRDEEYRLGYNNIFGRYFGNVESDKVILGKSIGIMYVREAAERLYEHNSNVELILMLRNPVDRAYSAYWYARSNGWEDIETFEEAIHADPFRFKELVRQRNCAYLDRSVYIKHIEMLLGLVAPERMHIFLLEDLKRAPVDVCKRLFTVAGVDPGFVPDLAMRYNKAAMVRSAGLAKLIADESRARILLRRLLPYRVTRSIRNGIKGLNRKTFAPPPMDSGTRARLVEFFRPHNRRLEVLIGRDLSMWDKL